MIHQSIEITQNYKELGLIHDKTPANMTIYIKDQFPSMQNPFKRPFIIICPGGGYDHHSPREGEAIAIKMLDFGYNAMVLHYSLLPNLYPCALYDLAYAVNYARNHSLEWDIDPNRIIVAGFSAGGHVAASLGTMWNQPELKNFLDINHLSAEDIMPNGMLLGYSVLTASRTNTRASLVKILGDNFDSYIDKISLVDRVTNETPKTFLWHTVTDGDVPVTDTLKFANALQKANVSFEIHIFPKGKHGLGLGTVETDMKDGTHSQIAVTVWPELFRTWVECEM